MEKNGSVNSQPLMKSQSHLNQTESIYDDSELTTVFGGFIKLNKSITIKHYISMLIHNILMGFVLSGTELLQQNILVSSEYYDLSPSEAVQYNSYLTLEDLACKFLVTPIYGALIDKLGRKTMIFCGLLLLIISYLLFPINYYSPSLFSSVGWYFVVRLIYSNSLAILPILPFIADYIHDSSKGRAIGINVLFLSSGFLISTQVVETLQEKNIYYTYLVFTVVIVVIGGIYSNLIKSGTKYYQLSQKDLKRSSVVTTPKVKPKELIKKATLSKPWIMAAYVFGFLNGAGLAITTQILNLYVQSFHLEDSKNLGTSIVKLANIATVLTAMTFGVLLDFINPLWVASLAFISGSIGYCTIQAIETPLGWIMKMVTISTGISYASTQLLTNFLGFKYFPKALRGLLFAFTNLFILLGVIIVTVIGGNLFKLNRNIPFYITAGITIFTLIIFIIIYIKHIKPWKQQQNNKKRNTKSVNNVKDPIVEQKEQESSSQDQPLVMQTEESSNNDLPDPIRPSEDQKVIEYQA